MGVERITHNTVRRYHPAGPKPDGKRQASLGNRQPLATVTNRPTQDPSVTQEASKVGVITPVDLTEIEAALLKRVGGILGSELHAPTSVDYDASLLPYFLQNRVHFQQFYDEVSPKIQGPNKIGDIAKIIADIVSQKIRK